MASPFNAISKKALAAYKKATLPKSYWDWGEHIDSNSAGAFPYTPATNLLFGLNEAILMLKEEGLDHVFARHKRFAEATRLAVQTWGLEVLNSLVLSSSTVRFSLYLYACITKSII